LVLMSCMSPAVQQSQFLGPWGQGAGYGTWYTTCEMFFYRREDFSLISRTGTVLASTFFFCVVSTCRCKLQEASMCSFCELTAIFFIVNHNWSPVDSSPTEPRVYMILYIQS
jgi:hypothetical protein